MRIKIAAVEFQFFPFPTNHSDVDVIEYDSNDGHESSMIETTGTKEGVRGRENREQILYEQALLRYSNTTISDWPFFFDLRNLII